MARLPYDEEEILADDVVIRRVNPQQHLVRDEISGTMRISSKLFSPSSGVYGGMSVDLLKLMEEASVDARQFVTTPVFTGSVQFCAATARRVTLRIGYDPIINRPSLEDNPYHGEVWGPEERPDRFTNAQKKALMQGSTWFVELEGVQISSD